MYSSGFSVPGSIATTFFDVMGSELLLNVILISFLKVPLEL
jgi:hypothetical protein